MITDKVDGFLVPQEDVPAITDALRRLVTDPDLCKAMGTAARTKAEAKFDHRINALSLHKQIRAAQGRTTCNSD